MNIHDVQQEEINTQTETVETETTETTTTLKIQTGVQAGFLGDLFRAANFKNDPLGLLY